MIITIEQLDSVIELASVREATYRKFQTKYFPDRVMHIGDFLKYNDTEEGREKESAKRNLFSFVQSLPYGAILDLDALMDYGRTLYQYGGYDQLVANVREGTENPDELLNPSKYFKKRRNHFESMYPVENFDSFHATEYLCEKLPLSEYLKNIRNLVAFF